MERMDLQCVPHPRNFTDKSKRLHSYYFMGLRRKLGVCAWKGEQFDIRYTIEEFKNRVRMYYTSRKQPGMEINVYRIEVNNIPLFVFPNGVRPKRSKNLMNQKRKGDDNLHTLNWENLILWQRLGMHYSCKKVILHWRMVRDWDQHFCLSLMTFAKDAHYFYFLFLDRFLSIRNSCIEIIF